MTFAICLTAAVVAACITGVAGFASCLVGAAIWLHALTPLEAGKSYAGSGEAIFPKVSSTPAASSQAAMAAEVRPSPCFDATND